jgi:ketosteroid isomerase-like protein
MSEDAVEVARRGWEAYERGDLSAAFADTSPDLITQVAAPLPVAGTYHGPEGLLQSLIDWAEGFDELDQKAQEFIDVGDGRVIVRVHQRGQVADTSVPVEGVFWFLLTVRQGKIVRVDICNERAEALEAAGLSE